MDTRPLGGPQARILGPGLSAVVLAASAESAGLRAARQAARGARVDRQRVKLRMVQQVFVAGDGSVGGVPNRPGEGGEQDVGVQDEAGQPALARPCSARLAACASGCAASSFVRLARNTRWVPIRFPTCPPTSANRRNGGSDAPCAIGIPLAWSRERHRATAAGNLRPGPAS